MRTYRMSVEEQVNFSSERFTTALEAAGFKFDRTECPIKLRKPWTMERQVDGTCLWSQWDYEQ